MKAQISESKTERTEQSNAEEKQKPKNLFRFPCFATTNVTFQLFSIESIFSGRNAELARGSMSAKRRIEWCQRILISQNVREIRKIR